MEDAVLSQLQRDFESAKGGNGVKPTMLAEAFTPDTIPTFLKVAIQSYCLEYAHGFRFEANGTILDPEDMSGGDGYLLAMCVNSLGSHAVLFPHLLPVTDGTANIDAAAVWEKQKQAIKTVAKDYWADAVVHVFFEPTDLLECLLGFFLKKDVSITVTSDTAVTFSQNLPCRRLTKLKSEKVKETFKGRLLAFILKEEEEVDMNLTSSTEVTFTQNRREKGGETVKEFVLELLKTVDVPFTFPQNLRTPRGETSKESVLESLKTMDVSISITSGSREFGSID